MRVDDFDFELPDDRIALRPVSPRHEAKLLNIMPDVSAFSDHKVLDLPNLLQPKDVLVFNNTKVIPARLVGRRVGRGETTPKIEVTLHKKITTTEWDAFVKPAKKLLEGDRLCFGDEALLEADVIEKRDGGEVHLRFDVEETQFEALLAQVGVMPLPPYIASKRGVDNQDYEDYQTRFAEKSGAVAAPTASLHFTDELMEALERKGIAHHFVTLHVGAGTFLPVKAEDTRDHKMHSEWAELDEKTADALNKARAEGGRIVSVGTTSLRVLESFASADGILRPACEATDIFITPGYEFRAVDILLTNFHLPRSTLFMLVSAFCGLDVMKQAYDHAIAGKYRFYSYGDACLLHRK